MAEIDRASVKDHGVVTRLLLDLFTERNSRPEPDRDNWERVIAELLDSDRWLFLVAYRSGEPVGLAVVNYFLSLFGSGEQARLDALYVEPDNRDSGIGSRLMERVLSSTHRRGCRELEIRVAPGEKRILGFYNRFSEAGEDLLLFWEYD